VRRGLLTTCLAGAASAMLVLWTLYGAFGHRVITYVYTSDHGAFAGIANRLMGQRSQTPLVDYLVRADTLVLTASLRALAVLAVAIVLVAAIKRVRIVLYGVPVVLSVGLVLLAVLELYPPLAYALNLDAVEYYTYKNILVPDSELVYRTKPLLHVGLLESGDAGPYGIKAARTASDWVTDDEGFRNPRALSSTDVVLIGDGMLNSGLTWEETFGARLEKHLHGLKVANLATSGHGPFQFVRALEVYGVGKQPKLAVLAINEGNDLQDVEKYLQWKAGAPRTFTGGYEVGIANPFLRLRTALSQTWKLVSQQCWDIAAAGFFSAVGNRQARYPLARDLAMIRLQGRDAFPMIFVDRQDTRPADALQSAAEWRHLVGLVSRFKTICHDHGIVPAMLFVPTAAHIYAEHSTDQSGPGWLSLRAGQIAAKMNQETAVANLSAQLGIPFISLSAPFEEAAARGEVLYDAFSVHLTPRGTEVAGVYVAGKVADLNARLDGFRQ